MWVSPGVVTSPMVVSGIPSWQTERSVERVAEQHLEEATFHVVGIGMRSSTSSPMQMGVSLEYELVRGSMTLVETDARSSSSSDWHES